jgi:hypothetical protein
LSIYEFTYIFSSSVWFQRKKSLRIKLGQSFLSSHHFLLFPIGFCNEFLFLSSSILSSKINQNQHNDETNAEDNGPGENVSFEVLNGPEEESDEDSQYSKNGSKHKQNIKAGFFTVKGVEVFRYWLPDWIRLTESAFVFVCVENSLS